MFNTSRSLRLALVAALGMSHVTYADSTPLTNDDIMRMVRARLSTSVVLGTLDGANVAFDLSPDGLIALKAAGVEDRMIEAMQARTRARDTGISTDAITRSGPENSELLAAAKDPQAIRRQFKTVVIDASKAVFFSTPQMKAALGADKQWKALGLVIVDDPVVADAVLEVSHTFAWDFPFSLRHQNTSVVLASGTGYGPFSGPLGAASVATDLAKQLKGYRAEASSKDSQ